MSKFVKILTKFWPKFWPQFRELDFELRESVKILPRFRSETPISVRNRVSVSETRKSAPNPSETAKNVFFCDFRSWSKISLIWSTFFDFSEILWISPIFFGRNPPKRVYLSVPSARNRKNVLQIKETRFLPPEPDFDPRFDPRFDPISMVSTPEMRFRPPKSH